MKVVELFCGAGGAALGLRNAGFEGVLHVDHDEDACATTHAAGFKNVLCEHVQHLTARDFPHALAWWASPPCPSWSSAGLRKGASDHRNGYPHLFRALELVAGPSGPGLPRWLLIEQVEGITFHRGKCPAKKMGKARWPSDCPACYLQAFILPTLRTFFPHVSMSVLDAADYGVPQRRNRLITVCGPARVPWPVPSHSAETLEDCKASGAYWRAVEDGSLFSRELPVGRDGCRPFRTMRQVLPALWGDPASEVVGGGRHPGRTRAGNDGRGEAERSMRKLQDGPSTTISAQYYGGAGNNGPFVVVSGTRGGKGPIARSADEPSPTVSTAGDLYAGGGADPRGRKISRSMRGVDRDRPSPSVSASGDDILLSEDTRPERPEWWHRSSPMDEPSRTVGAMGNAAVSFGSEDAVEPWRLDQPSPTVSATEVKGAGNRTNRRARGEVVESSAGVDRASDALLLGTGRRRLEPVECAILQGFPADHPFQGKRGSVYAQAGNACPPRLVEVVAREVLRVDKRL